MVVVIEVSVVVVIGDLVAAAVTEEAVVIEALGGINAPVDQENSIEEKRDKRNSENPIHVR